MFRIDSIEHFHIDFDKGTRMQVKSVMAKAIATVFPDTKVRDIWKVLGRKHVNAVPVVDKRKKLVGLITRKELLTALYPKYKNFSESYEDPRFFEELEDNVRDVGNAEAKDIMHKRVIFTRDSTQVMRALSRMIARNVNQMPVLADNNTVIGIITKSDIFQALYNRLARVVKNH